MLKIKSDKVQADQRRQELWEYVRDLRSPYERSLCERYLQGETIKQLAVSESCSTKDIEDDLRAALAEIAERVIGTERKGEEDA